ncbi:IS701 family transposase [Micromonospora sp. SCSIO 07396]
MAYGLPNPTVRLEDTSRLSRFCQNMLTSLSRSDQRRWGEVYVRGLLTVPGRKSVRGISEVIVGGGADQGIQQFVNQSPWEWAPVRRELSTFVHSRYRPTAWVFEEVVLPKNGANSVGVARQYAPTVGRVMNCQLGLSAFLVGEGPSDIVPVNWRLHLPPEWDADAGRRTRAHIPSTERHRSRWQSLLDMVCEMTMNWELAPVPIVLDAHHDTQVEPLLKAFDERGLRYVVRVAAGTPVGTEAGGALTAGEFAASLARNGNGSTSLNWRDDNSGLLATSRLVMQVLPRPVGGDLGFWWNRPRHLLAEWSAGRHRPTGIWLTNLRSPRIPQLVDLIRTQPRARAEMARLRDEFGLAHFEGRSFRGWHHHTTLVSLAHAYAKTNRPDEVFTIGRLPQCVSKASGGATHRCRV